MKAKYQIFIFFTLIGIYFSQGILYPSSSALSQTILIILLVFCLSFINNIFLLKNKSTFLRYWSLFIIFIVIQFVFTGDHSDSKHIGQFKNILFFMLPFYPVYYLTRFKKFKIVHLKLLMWLLFPIFILRFTLNSELKMTELDKENIVNNTAYFLVCLIPFLFFIKRKILAYVLACIIFIFVVIGSKRGALLVSLSSFSIFFYFSFFIQNSKKIYKKIMYLIIITSAIYMSITYSSYFLESNSFFVERIEGNKSTRYNNYQALINNWFQSTSIKELILGFGFSSARNYTPEGVMAHNDWLEILTNFGAIGVLLYSIMFSHFIKLSKFLESTFKYSHYSIIVTWLLISMFSMWFNSFYNISYSILIGFIVGSIDYGKYVYNE